MKSTIVGPGADLEKEVVILNRKITWGEKGIMWEADPRHAEKIISELSLNNASGVGGPCIEEIKGLGEERKKSWSLKDQDATKYRSLVARGNYLSADRADIQYAIRSLSKGMSEPTGADQKHLKHFGRYLVRVPT